MPVTHALALGAHGQTGVALSRVGDHRSTSGSAGHAIDLNRAPLTGGTTPTVSKKPCHISTADMPRTVNPVNDMPEHARAPTEEVMTHRTCQLSLSVG
jgi:hypothetical protein